MGDSRGGDRSYLGPSRRGTPDRPLPGTPLPRVETYSTGMSCTTPVSWEVAIEHCWPDSDRQHCAVHRVRNLLAKLPEPQRDRVRHAYWQALDDAINPRDAKQRLQSLVDELQTGGFGSAARCLADDLDALVAHLRYPTRHRRRWRSTNLLERSLGEVKRRTKVIGRFPGEDSCLTLVWAVLDLLITHETNGIHFTALDRQHLNSSRYTAPDAAPEEVTAA